MHAKETYYARKRDLLAVWHWHTSASSSTLKCQKRPVTQAKESYYARKRDLLTVWNWHTSASEARRRCPASQCMQTQMSLSASNPLGSGSLAWGTHTRQKKTIMHAKETYYGRKRDLLTVWHWHTWDFLTSGSHASRDQSPANRRVRGADCRTRESTSHSSLPRVLAWRRFSEVSSLVYVMGLFWHYDRSLLTQILRSQCPIFTI